MKSKKIIISIFSFILIHQAIAQPFASITADEISQLQAQYIAQFNNAEQAAPINKELIFTPKHAIKATLNYTSNVPAYNLLEADLYIPNPPSFARQTIMSASVTTDPDPQFNRVESDLNKIHHSIIETDINTIQHENGFKAALTINAVINQIVLVDIPQGQARPTVKPLSYDEYLLALRTTKMFDYNNPAFKQWLDENNLHPTLNETRLDFAKRVYIFIENHFQYYYDKNWNRAATNTIATGKTDCGGFSILFSSVMRYHGIPARALVGRWAISGNAVNPYQSHVKSEFYLDNIGWVPLDVTSGVSFHTSSDDVRFFAREPGNFITFYIDPGIIVNTFYGLKNMPFLQSFVYWVKSLGDFSDVSSETWTVIPN